MLSAFFLRFLSDSGKSYAFDYRGSGGYGRGEGLGCLILQTLPEAIRMNNSIRSVVVNTG